MLKLLFLPGALFLLVIFFRVVMPYLSTAPWKRLLDSALYHRSRKEFDKSDELLNKALARFPGQPEVYLDYYLNYSTAGDIAHRFQILRDGYGRTGDVILGFFIGSAYLEHGMFEEAEELLGSPQCRKYMLKKGISLLPELYYEAEDYIKAEEEFFNFYRELYSGPENKNELLSELSPSELITLALIRKKSGGDYSAVMMHAPKSSLHTDMSWLDLRTSLNDKLSSLKPAATGISGDPGEFNRRRRNYYQSRIQLIESFL